jgi:hypothetical protein
MIAKSSNTTNLHLVSLQGRLANDLKISFGQAPAVAQAIALRADEIYHSEGSLTTPGTMLYSATHVSEPSGKPLNMCKRASVKLTIWKNSDNNIKDMKVRKKEIFRRIAQEAYEQEGILTIEDCENILLTSKRTLKQYVAEFKRADVYLPLRGYVHSTGRGQTHKTEIICLYLEGVNFEDIRLRTYHSIEAISRYITMFQRIITCYENQKMKVQDISTVVNVSPDLVRDYLKIYERYSLEENDRLDMILNPPEFENFIQPFKKKKVST